MAVAALEHAVDQQLAVAAGAQRRAGDDLAERAQLRLRVVLDLDQDGGAERAQRALDAVGVEVAELPGQRDRELGRRRTGHRRVQPERHGRGRPAHRCVSVAAAHVPTSAELCSSCPSGVPDGIAS